MSHLSLTVAPLSALQDRCLKLSCVKAVVFVYIQYILSPMYESAELQSRAATKGYFYD